MKTILIFAPIVTLLVVGLLISIRSNGGIAGSTSGIKGWFGTFSTIVMNLAAYLLVLFGLQTAVGFPVRLLFPL